MIAVFLSMSLHIGLLNLAAWNILCACGLLYGTQGFGIVAFWISKPAFPPLGRFFVLVLLFIVLFSPGVNFIVFILLILLGVADNWAGFRRFA